MREKRKHNKIKKDWVSVIMPTYNRAPIILKSLNSVFKQSYRPIEIIIIDDGSTDKTENIVKTWKKDKESSDFQIYYHKQTNSGAQVARNIGIAHASGQYLQFLDSDDLIKPQKFELQISLMKKENTPICLADYTIETDLGEFIELRQRNFSIQYLIGHFLSVHTTPPIIDKTYYPSQCLHWTENTPKLQDIEFFMKILIFSRSKSYVSKVLSVWVQHSAERITEHKNYNGKRHYGRRVYWIIFNNLLKFYKENRQHILPQNINSTKRMLLKLLLSCIGLRRFLRALKAKLF